MHVTSQRFGDLSLFGLVWQYSTNQNQYNKGRLKVMAMVVRLSNIRPKTGKKMHFSENLNFITIGYTKLGAVHKLQEEGGR